MLREMVSLALARAGYEVIVAASGEEALAILEDSVVLSGLYTDIQLPGSIDGWQLGTAFHVRWPSLPIVYASARKRRGEQVVSTGIFFEKPFRLERVVAAFAKHQRKTALAA